VKDRHGREHVYLRLAVTDRCNLRCTYCMPSAVSFKERASLLSFEEIVRLASILARLGVRKLRITGGEPTMRKGIVELCQRLSAIPGIETLALTTNGVRLGTLARPLFAAGVRRLNVSLDSVRRDRFARITGKDLLPGVMAGIDEALAAGFVPLKVNTVVMAGVNDDELLDFAALARDRPLDVRFIEFMPFKDNGWREERFLPCIAMMAAIGSVHPLVPAGRPERTGGVAQDFAVPGFLGRVSFVTPFSDSFCERCNRLRVTADGQLKTCLYSAPEADLRTALRRGDSDESLEETISSALWRKPEGHPPLRELAGRTETAMNAVGG
jgi:cyclic pyranopterin phosphate synthase